MMKNIVYEHITSKGDLDSYFKVLCALPAILDRPTYRFTKGLFIEWYTANSFGMEHIDVDGYDLMYDDIKISVKALNKNLFGNRSTASKKIRMKNVLGESNSEMDFDVCMVIQIPSGKNPKVVPAIHLFDKCNMQTERTRDAIMGRFHVDDALTVECNESYRGSLNCCVFSELMDLLYRDMKKRILEL